jgi:diguanylate cyclase (GGDEF)-like protein
VVIVLHDVTELRALSHELVYHATHDALTGLLNRREFDRRLKEAMDTTRRDGRGYLLCYLDLDLFKAINDVCGHLAGDELLRQVGMRLRNAVRPADAVARIGGDEFAILLEDCVLAEGEQIGDEIRRVVREHRFTWDNKSFDLGVSMGVVPISASAGTLQDVLRTADHACRKAKAQGRNRVFVVSGALAANPEMEVGWAETLGLALAESGFVLYGQWVYPLAATPTPPSHCEVLLRLRRDGELISPNAFLPAAERYHIMPAIDRWVIREAFVTLSQHSLRADTCFNINLSGQSLCDPDFLEYVLGQFEETGMPPARICFEITETAAIINMTSATRFIARLNDIGCSFALDDFGSGLSSFGYLKSLRVRYIKIDGVFVRDVADDPVDRAMVWCINEMAHVMDIQTIAEYVESEAVRAELRAIGVDFGQGLFLAEPKPLAVLLIGGDAQTATPTRLASLRGV